MPISEPQRCPFCAELLETKDGLLYCPAQKIFIGDQKTMSESDMHTLRKTSSEEKGEDLPKATKPSAHRSILVALVLGALVVSAVLYWNRQRVIPVTRESDISLPVSETQAPLAGLPPSAPTKAPAASPPGDPFTLPKLFAGVSWEAPVYQYAKTVMRDNNFKLNPLKGRIYSWFETGLEGKMWAKKLTIADYSEVVALSAAFEKYYADALGELGWTQSLIWNNQQFDFVRVDKPDTKLHIYGKSAGEDLRFVLLEQHITNPSACPCSIELNLFVSQEYTRDYVFPVKETQN